MHEECLTGFTSYGATVYPAAIAWGATFDPDLVERMAAAIGRDMAALGIHQGLAPVLDVVRDYRWGRVEETIGEDPYLVAVLGAAYVRGLQSAGVLATLKHFAGYSASRGARNHGPVSMGGRELADVVLPPFEAAVTLAGAASVMNSYSDVDGVPAGADAWLLTELLRDTWGFTGTVVSDYWAVPFLTRMHRIAADDADAGAQALAAGLDVELPDTIGFAGLVEKVRSGELPEEVLDRAARRVLTQKAELGLLDPDWTPEASVAGAERVDLDSPANRALARELAEGSIVLLDAGSALPLLGDGRPGRVASRWSGRARTTAAPSWAATPSPTTCPRASRASASGSTCRPRWTPSARSSPVWTSSTPAAATSATPTGPASPRPSTRPAAPTSSWRSSATCAGLFGRGTSGEGCDAEDLGLPGVQADLVEELLATGTPVVVVVVSGRPYALGSVQGRAAALVQAFMPGEEGGAAIAGVLSGRVQPSGKLPVQIPRHAGWSARHLPPAAARRGSHRHQQPRPPPALPLRARHRLHHLRRERPAAERGRGAHRRRGRRDGAGPQHRLARRHRGGAALPA